MNVSSVLLPGTRGNLVLAPPRTTTRNKAQSVDEGTPLGPEQLLDALPYRIELWDMDKAAVERHLALTISGAIAYAAFYAAGRDFPDRRITLRHKNRILSTFG